MKKKSTTLLTFLFFYSALGAWGLMPDFSIRYFNKKIYYPGSDIELQVTFSNPTTKTISFRIAQNRSYNFLFTVKTMQNETLPPSREYLIDYNRNEPAFYRQIDLEPGEEFGFTVRLDSFVKVQEPGVYVLEGVFFPDLKSQEPGGGIPSNSLSLTIRPGVQSSKIGDIIDGETGEILQLIQLPPDEVVSYVLQARQKSQWNKFFLYLDLKEILLQSTMTKRQFDQLSEEGQYLALEQYKQDLKTNRVLPEDQGIVALPSEFNILQTTYTDNEATVIVREVFDNISFKEIKRYTYYLHRNENVWKVYNYEVKNIGTE